MALASVEAGRPAAEAGAGRRGGRRGRCRRGGCRRAGGQAQGRAPRGAGHPQVVTGPGAAAGDGGAGGHFAEDRRRINLVLII